ncbi:aromatic prenyltransferase [Xylariaceae sp. FL0662B]|nr:aromatic prenyltransferase [Xylariaceae sp. FL0662B]
MNTLTFELYLISGGEFWSKHARSTLGPLLSLAGTYTASDQASHLRFFDEHVASYLGSQQIEPKNNAREVLHRLCVATGGDPRLMDHLMEAFFLSPVETVALRDKVRPHMQIPPACIAFELEGQRQILKAYIPVLRKAALGKSVVDITLNALRDLEPLGYDLSYNLDLLDDCQGEADPMMIGIDCLDPRTNRGSRVKVYVHFKNCTVAVARDVITLGGRLSDEPTLKKVNLLRSIRHLLLNEPDGIPDDKIDTWSKQERAPGIYVPVFQYAERTETAFRNTNAVLKTVGHEWGQTGRFNEVAMAVFEQRSGRQKSHGQSHLSYSYTESKGVYLTAYFGIPGFHGERITDAYNILD